MTLKSFRSVIVSRLAFVVARRPVAIRFAACHASLALCLLTSGSPAMAAITYVSSAIGPLSSSAVSSIQITAPAGVITGDLMIATIAQAGGNFPIVQTVPSGWTLIRSDNDGSSVGINLYRKVATASEPGSYTWQYRDNDRSAGAIAVYRGVDTASPVVTSAAQTNNASTSYTAPSITPGIVNTMIVAVYGVADGNGGVNVPSGMAQAFVAPTSAGPNGLVIGSFYVTQAASTATGTKVSTGNPSVKNIGVLLALRPSATVSPDHYAISHSGSGVNCQAVPVTIAAHDAAHAAMATTDAITLGTSTGRGDWSLTTGGGSFAAGAANSGTATYTYVTADNGVVVLSLKDTVAETVSINVAGGSVTEKTGTALASEDPNLSFSASGFRITNGGNVPIAIGTQIAGKSSGASPGAQTLALQAIRTDINTGACTAVFASGTTVNVDLAYQCNNPTACLAGQTLGITNNAATTNVAANPASAVTTYTSVPLRFGTANSEALFSLEYSDVGQITLFARYNIPLVGGTSSGILMTGGSLFVVQPAGFTLSGIKCTTYGAGTCGPGLAAPGINPGAASASGPIFIQAGQSFSATVTATNLAGAPTPNYGREISPEGARLTANLVLPAGGTSAAVNNATAFGSFSGGAATGTSFNWPEVGIAALTPSVGDGSYLGSGDVTGATSGNVGRFIPNDLLVTMNTPLFLTGCSAGGFTYIGQPFAYSVAPVFTATARAFGGATTRNYTGAFFKMTNSTLTGRTYSATTGTLDMSGVPAATTDPAIVDLANGAGTLTFSSGTGIAFNRATPVTPFDAAISLSINVLDADGVAATSNPASVGGAGGIGFSAGANQLYGRVAFRNALGSELVNLPLPLRAEYYASDSVGFITHSADSCATPVTLTAIAYGGSLTSGKTCALDSGSPGVSTFGCAAAAAVTARFKVPPAAGDFNLTLAAPGAGNGGTVTLQATVPNWLKFDWNQAAAGNEFPTGIATFGVYNGKDTRIYERETY